MRALICQNDIVSLQTETSADTLIDEQTTAQSGAVSNELVTNVAIQTLAIAKCVGNSDAQAHNIITIEISGAKGTFSNNAVHDCIVDAC